MPQKLWNALENNPKVMNHLAHTLGLSKALTFHDIYSLTDASLLSLIPRPVHALLVIIPMTPTWHESRSAEDNDMPSEYAGKGASEPVLWFKQTIGNACGSISLIHCLLNSPSAAPHIAPDSTLDRIRRDAVDKPMRDRVKVLESCAALETAHAEAVALGETQVPASLTEGAHREQHFVAFVKARDGHLWELEGARAGPLDRGLLGDGEDVLSEKALERGLGRLMRMEAEKGGDLRFSAIALAESWEEA